VKRTQGLPVRGDEQVDVARQRYVERKAAAKFSGGDAEHRTQMTAKTLG